MGVEGYIQSDGRRRVLFCVFLYIRSNTKDRVCIKEEIEEEEEEKGRREDNNSVPSNAMRDWT